MDGWKAGKAAAIIGKSAVNKHDNGKEGVTAVRRFLSTHIYIRVLLQIFVDWCWVSHKTEVGIFDLFWGMMPQRERQLSREWYAYSRKSVLHICIDFWHSRRRRRRCCGCWLKHVSDGLSCFVLIFVLPIQTWYAIFLQKYTRRVNTPSSCGIYCYIL